MDERESSVAAAKSGITAVAANARSSRRLKDIPPASLETAALRVYELGLSGGFAIHFCRQFFAGLERHGLTGGNFNGFAGLRVAALTSFFSRATKFPNHAGLPFHPWQARRKLL